MKQLSDQENNSKIDQVIIQALDNSVDGLSEQEQNDIKQVRYIALERLKTKDKTSFIQWSINKIANKLMVSVTLPIAAALLIVISLSNQKVHTIPAMPMAMLTGEVPTEDLAMLEDLEFVTWLAKNEENIVL